MLSMREILLPVLVGTTVIPSCFYHPSIFLLTLLMSLIVWVLYPLFYLLPPITKSTTPYTSNKTKSQIDADVDSKQFQCVLVPQQNRSKDPNNENIFKRVTRTNEVGLLKLDSSQQMSSQSLRKTKNKSIPASVSKTNETVSNKTKSSEYKWRCACEGGFLPPGLLKNFSGVESVMRLGSGQCYHKT